MGGQRLIGLGETILGNLEMGPVYLERLAAVGVEVTAGVPAIFGFSESLAGLSWAHPQASNSNRISAAFRVQILNAIPFPMERVLSTNMIRDCPDAPLCD